MMEALRVMTYFKVSLSTCSWDSAFFMSGNHPLLPLSAPPVIPTVWCFVKEAERNQGHQQGRHMHLKPHLPEKICPVCLRPFAWRRKWARCWQEVRYCSERCRRRKEHP